MKKNKKRAIESIVALIKSEGLNPADSDACLASLSETCLPSQLSSIYLDYVLPVAIECSELEADFNRLMNWRISIW